MVRLTVERKARGWTQDQLQGRSGVNATSISLAESGRYQLSEAQLLRLARALGIAEPEAPRLLEPLPIQPLGLAE